MAGGMFVKASGVFLILLGIIGMAASGYGVLLAGKISEGKLTLSLTEALTELNLDIIKGKDKTESRLNKSSSNIESAGNKIDSAGGKISSGSEKMKIAGSKLNSSELIAAAADFTAASEDLGGASTDIKQAGNDLKETKNSLSELLLRISSSIDSTVQGIEAMAKGGRVKKALYGVLGYLFLIHFVLFVIGASLLMVSSGEPEDMYYRERGYGREEDEGVEEEAEEVMEEIEEGIGEES